MGVFGEVGLLGWFLGFGDGFGGGCALDGLGDEWGLFFGLWVLGFLWVGVVCLVVFLIWLFFGVFWGFLGFFVVGCFFGFWVLFFVWCVVLLGRKVY
jgi:hypothetical protein